MKNILRLLVFTIMGSVALGGAITVLAKSKAPTENLLKNGNFAQWKTTAASSVAKIHLLQHKVPVDWPYIDNEAYGLAGNPNFPNKGAVGRSTHVKRPGSTCSLLIQNGLSTDITSVSQMIRVQPGTIYKVSVWIKGADIQQNHRYGGGVNVWANWGPKNFWPHQHGVVRQPKPSTGTFGWRKLTFTVDTGKGAKYMTVVLQLRCATGKAWFDHVSVVKAGKFTPVKSF